MPLPEQQDYGTLFLSECHILADMKRFLNIVIASLIICVSASGQTEDILWASFQLNKSIDKNWSFSIKPTIRENQDFSNFQNASVDLVVKRKLGKGWGAQFLNRIWFLPDREDRTFWWWDISHKATIPSLNLAITNRVRYHLALDTRENQELDYIRYLVSLSLTNDWKVKPTFYYEPWFILNDVERFRLSRLSPGVVITVDDRTSLVGQLWRQLERRPDESTFHQNLWVVTLSYTL